MHLLFKEALATAIITLTLVVGAELPQRKKVLPTPPTITSVVCNGFERSGNGVSSVFGKRTLLDGACSWYCNRYLVTLPYVGGTLIPHTEAEVSAKVRRLSDGQTQTHALFAQPLTTSLNWTLGLGPDPIFHEKYTRLTAEELDGIGFGGLLVANGNRRSATDYQRYARLKAARLFVDDTCVAILHFADTPRVQWLKMNRLFALDTLHQRRLRLQVTAVYPGRQSTQLAISELQLDGAGGHSISYRMCPGN